MTVFKNFVGAKRPPSYRSFRNDAVRRGLRRKRRVLTKAVAALALAAAALWTTLALPRPASGARPALASEAACVEAERRIAPRFRAERDRVAHIGLPPGSSFNLLLTWFDATRGQCAAGLTDRAAANFQALETMLPQPNEPEPEDE